MTSKPTVTIGICAYHSQGLIEELLKSLVVQKMDGFGLKKILIHCDQSGDQTIQVAKAWIKKNNYQKLIKIFSPTHKLGFAGSFQQILKKSNTDLVVILNDDIQIKQKNFISKIAASFEKNQDLGLVAVNLKPLSPRTLVEKATIASINVYKEARLSVAGGNNLYSCDGKVLALSKKFYQNIIWPKNFRLLGNLDAYLYMLAISKKYKFRYLPKVSAWHRCPSTLEEYIAWTSRNNANYYLLQKTFGDLVKREYYLPRKILWQKKFQQLLKNPFECLLLFGTSFYIRNLSKRQAQNFNPKWESLLTTKTFN